MDHEERGDGPMSVMAMLRQLSGMPYLWCAQQSEFSDLSSPFSVKQILNFVI